MAKQIETFEGIEYERSLLGQVEPVNNGVIALLRTNIAIFSTLMHERSLLGQVELANNGVIALERTDIAS